uniref:Facilitated trehalose transporter Tret1 n=1 Tax=Cacopsylla melanoneura TaxID=428564 RepID=A0A8D9DTT1_9HEMI
MFNLIWRIKLVEFVSSLFRSDELKSKSGSGSSDHSTKRHHENYSENLVIWRSLIATLSAHSVNLSIGMCQGFSAVLIPQLMQPSSHIQITYHESSWIASLGVISNPLGALMSGTIMEVWGRKTTLQVAAFPFLTGWLLMACADNLVNLCIGRFITGVAIGMGSSTYVYVSEISLPAYRGLFASLGPVFVSLGVLFVYYMGYMLHWHIVCYFCAVSACISFIVVSFMPETPSWYASKGLVVKSTASLNWLRNNSAIANVEIADILQSISEKDEDNKSCCQKLREFIQPTVWKPFFTLCGFFMLQQGSGIYIILYYAVNFFQKVGSSMDAWKASISMAVMRLVMSVVGSIFIQNYGRRTLAMISGLGMALSMGACGLYEHYFEGVPADMRLDPLIPFIFILLNVCASMLGTLQLPWIMTGELFPLSVRGFMQGFMSCIAYILIFITVKIYPFLSTHLDIATTMYIFAGSSTLITLFAFFVLPETQGKTLLEIERTFQGNNLPFSSIDQEKGDAKPVKQKNKAELNS